MQSPHRASKESGIKLNQELLDVYHKWDNENPFDLGDGWGKEPWSQKEMPLEDSLAARAAKRCQTAIAVIGRTSGEEQDNSLTEGSFLLSSDEKQMLTTVRRHFSKMIVLLNVGNINHAAGAGTAFIIMKLNPAK